MAEKVLEVSARSFSKALHPEKSHDVIKILENIRQERELALSLNEVLRTPMVSSTTTSFIVPSPSHEYSVGIEAFEHADLQANLFTKSMDLKSGEDFDLFIELFNTGREPASLVKIEDIIPDDFEVSKISGYYMFKDKCLDMKGRKIGPLSSVEIELQVKPLSKGEYTFKPHIVFLDDTGEYKSCEPEPVSVSVKEMGILGWIRGSLPSR